MSDTMESFKDVGGSSSTAQPSVRIKHLTRNSDGSSRFPKLDECAHFHYDNVELGPIEVSLCDEDEDQPQSSSKGGGGEEVVGLCVRVSSNGKSWQIRRSLDNFLMLDRQLHRCVYDRKFSLLADISLQQSEDAAFRSMLTQYLERFSQLAGSLINCGPVLNWLELDNRGNRLIVTDEAAINTPAVAAAYVIKRYAAQAPDEISLEVGDIISVIDMPPPDESSWWRGKKGFQVGFFPCECVETFGDKVPQSFKIPKSTSKPVLRKHGKLIAFFRSFLLSRPSRRKLKQSGILKERVFGCDLGEHLMNSARDIPLVLKCCTEFIEQYGIVDGIYRLSGVTSNIQKLRLAFDEERVPDLQDEAILQDIHCVASLLKMYFRELPNPLLTFHLYDKFVHAVQAEESTRLLRLRDVVQQLPPPHYRSLEFLMRHLSKVAAHGPRTGMTPKNVAIVWAPNLLRSRDVENGGVGALHVVGVQAVLTEYLIRYTDIIFSEKMPVFPSPKLTEGGETPKKTRPKSLAISTPTKLLSLEEARSRALSAHLPPDKFIEVGGGEQGLPAKYHTVIELPARRRSVGTKSKSSPSGGWKSFFSRGWQTTSGRRRKRRERPKIGSPVFLEPLVTQDKAVTESDVSHSNSKKLRTVKSAEALFPLDTSLDNSKEENDLTEEPEEGGEDGRNSHLSLVSSCKQHTRSISHDSYFERSPAPDYPSEADRRTVKKQKLAEDHPSDASSPKLQKLNRADDLVTAAEINNQQVDEEMDVSMEATLSESAARVSQLLSFDGPFSPMTPDSPTGDNLSDIPSSSSDDSPMSDHRKSDLLVDQTRQLQIDPLGVGESTLPSPVSQKQSEGSFVGDIILSPPESFVDPTRSPDVAKSPDVVKSLDTTISPNATGSLNITISPYVSRSPDSNRSLDANSPDIAKSLDTSNSPDKSVDPCRSGVATKFPDIAKCADEGPDVAKGLASEIRAHSRSPCARPLERSKTEVHEICPPKGMAVSGSFGHELFKANSDFVEAHIFNNGNKKRGDKLTSPVSPIEDTKRKFESEIGRLIVRDRQMKLEMERMKAERQKRRVEVSSISESSSSSSSRRKPELAELQKSPIRSFEAERKNSDDPLRTVRENLEKPADTSPSNDYSRYIRMKNKPSVKELLSKFEGQKASDSPPRPLEYSQSGVFSNVQVINHNFPLTSSKSFASSLEEHRNDNRHKKEHIFQTECVIRFPHPKSSKLADSPSKWANGGSEHSSPRREQQQNGGSFTSFADTFHRATAQMRTEFLQRGLPPSNGFESFHHYSRSPPEVRKKPVATRQRPKSVPPPVCRLSYAPPPVVSNGQGSSSSQTFGPPKRVKDRAAIFERSLSFSGDKRPPRQTDTR